MAYSNPYTAADLDAISAARWSSAVKDPAAVSWPKADIETYIQSQMSLYAGEVLIATATPTSGNTKSVDFTIVDDNFALPTDTVTIDWGDGSAVSSVAMSAVASPQKTAHVYATAGLKIITFKCKNRVAVIKFTSV